MKNINFENLWNWLLFTIVAGFCAIIAISMVSSHKVNNYYVAMNENLITICIDVNWCEDEKIKLDKSITLEEAIELCNELNKTLKK
jgi:hypothetical protein